SAILAIGGTWRCTSVAAQWPGLSACSVCPRYLPDLLAHLNVQPAAGELVVKLIDANQHQVDVMSSTQVCMRLCCVSTPLAESCTRFAHSSGQPCRTGR